MELYERIFKPLDYFRRYGKGFEQLPEKYKTERNYDTYCELSYYGLDTLMIFKTEIKKIENGSK